MVRGQVVPVQKKQFKAPYKTRKMKAQASLHNRFDIEVLGPDGKVRQRARAYNIILNGLWTYMLASATATYRTLWFYAIHFGSGTGTLDASRTALFTSIGNKTVTRGSFVVDTSGFDDGWVSFTNSITLDAGEYDGNTLREVGIGNYAGSLMTHAVLEDMNGNPTSITIGELDVVVIYATVYVRFEAGGFDDGNIVFDETYSTDLTYGILAAIGGAMSPVAVSQRTFANLLGRLSAYDTLGALIGSIDDTAAVSVNATAKTITVTLANSNGKRISVSQLNPAGGGGWKKIAYFFNGDSNRKNIEVLFPNTAKPYCQITDEVVGEGDGETKIFALDFGSIPNDSTFVLKVNGITVNTEDYTVDFNQIFVPSSRFKYYCTVIDGNSSLITSSVTSSNVYVTIENPYYTDVAITQIVLSRCKIEVSNDGTNWTEIYFTSSADKTHDVLAEYQNYRYWKFTKTSSSGGGITTITPSTGLPRVIFDTAPADGAAITASYRTKSICKDTNHVVDLELELTLNEYTES